MQVPSSETEPAALHRTRARWALAAALAALACYAHTLGHGWAFDDDIVVVRNRFIRAFAHLGELVTRTEWAGGGLEVRAYRPLTGVTYALNHAVSGLAPWSYHAVNVVLHALASVGVLLLALRWRAPLAAAGAAAVAFAVHPLHVEAVANVIGRKDVLAALFVLATALAHGWATRRGGARLAVPVLLYAAAMLSKEAGVVALAFVVLQDLLVPEPDAAPAVRRRRAVLYAGYAAALVAYLALYGAVTGGIDAPQGIPHVDNPAAADPAVRIPTAVAMLGKGLLLHVLPAGLSPDYSFDAIPVATTPLDPRVLGALLAFGAWAWVGWRLRRDTPAVLLGLGVYLAAAFPTSNLAFPVGTIFGERLLYLPSAGAAVAAGVAFAALLRRAPRPAWAAGSAAALVLAAVAVQYASAWRDDATLFAYAVGSQPRSAKIHMKLAEVRDRDDDQEAVLAHGRRALELAPDLARARDLVAGALISVGRPAEARAMVDAALAQDPGDVGALYIAGRLARDAGDLAAAEAAWRRALATDPDHAATLADVGTLHLVRGEPALAEPLLARAVELTPHLANAWYNLALVRRGRGDAAGARAALEQFVVNAGAAYRAEVDAVRARLARGEL